MCCMNVKLLNPTPNLIVTYHGYCEADYSQTSESNLQKHNGHDSAD